MNHYLLRKITKFLAGLSGDVVIEANHHERLVNLARMGFKLPVLREVSSEEESQLIELIINSNSQIGADLICLHRLNYKQDGYFVEFGGYDGIAHSNTLLLEEYFNWTGILAEASRNFFSELTKNRPNCRLENSCITGTSKSHSRFVECIDGELSTQAKYLKQGSLAERRVKKKTYDVPTLSLKDLLDKHSAPRHIDFLSIDVEGGETEILEGFDFSSYSFSMIAVEHGWTDSEDKMDQILGKNGYTRQLEGLSKIDAWYFQKTEKGTNQN
jgi:FkbM family methyltransferase|tara:strand:+ start:840 stop:1652 length:813 start_codon:yes stop_codon:yes gene_type:complete